MNTPQSKRSKSKIVHMSMLARCKEGGIYQRNAPTYIGCKMSENFKDFKKFEIWHRSQIGYGCDDYDIDKDLLIEGNKLYSEDTCVLIPAALNAFLTFRQTTKNSLPIGVCEQRIGKFKAAIKIDGCVKYLGVFNTAVDAGNAYVIAKELEAKRWIFRLENQEFLVDRRAIERLKNWKFPL